MKEKLFADKAFYQKLTRLMLPIALQSLMLAAVAAGDAVMLGRVEQNSMAAVSLATQIQFVQNMILGAVAGGVGILGAQYWGKGDKDTVRTIFNMSLRTNALAGIVFFVGCVFFPRALMILFTDEPALIEIGIRYLKIAGWSYLLTGLSQCYLTVMRISSHVTRSAWISSGAVVINIIFNAVFIFGLGPIPAMGAEGAALATLIARVIELIWAVVSSFQEGYIRPDLARFFARNRRLALDFWKCALPIMGASMLWGVGFTSYTAFMGHMGTDAAAANSVAAVVRDLFCCLCNGISAAGGIMVGNELGAGHLEKGKLYGQRITKIAFIIGFGTMLLVLMVIVPVSRFMILTDHARNLLVGMMIIMAVYMIGRCVNTIVINGVFSAGGDTLFDMYSLAVCMWGLAVPLAALGCFVLNWHPFVVYACTCLDEVGKIPWVMIHYRKYKWVRDLTRDDLAADK